MNRRTGRIQTETDNTDLTEMTQTGTKTEHRRKNDGWVLQKSNRKKTGNRQTTEYTNRQNTAGNDTDRQTD